MGRHMIYSSDHHMIHDTVAAGIDRGMGRREEMLALRSKSGRYHFEIAGKGGG